MDRRRLALPLLALVAGAFALACGDHAISPNDPTGLVPAFSHKPGHNPGGGGGSSGSELSMLGGLAGGATAANIERDNNKWLSFSSSELSVTDLAVTINFDDTKSGALSDCPGANCPCTGDLSLIGALVAPSKPARVTAKFDKQAVRDGVPTPYNWYRISRGQILDEPLVDLNFATRPPDLLVTLTSGNLDDASQPRVFELTGGVVQVIQGVDENTTTGMQCDQHVNDPVTVTLEPSPGS